MSASATFDEKKQIFTNLEAATTASACVINLPTLQSFGQRANCYGPSVNYTSHPDGSGGNGQFPSGDLGLWSTTETGGVACAAAQMNKLVETASSYIDLSMGLSASVICLARVNAISVPSEGSTVDLTTIVNTALTDASLGISVSSVTAKQEDGAMKLILLASLPGSKSLSLNLKHKETSSTVSKGQVWGIVSDSGGKNAFTLGYNKASGRLNAEMYAGQYSSSTADNSILSSSGVIAPTIFSGNMNHALFNLSTTDGSGQVSYAWQAGSGDGFTRVFNVFVESISNSRSGCGYFSYGPAFSSTLSSNTNSFTRFICNWAGPGNNRNNTSFNGYAQKQCFEESSGKLTPISGQSYIDYAPINDCQIAVPGAFTYDFPSHYVSVPATHNLVNTVSDNEYITKYSAPQIPTVSF